MRGNLLLIVLLPSLAFAMPLVLTMPNKRAYPIFLENQRTAQTIEIQVSKPDEEPFEIFLLHADHWVIKYYSRFFGAFATSFEAPLKNYIPPNRFLNILTLHLEKVGRQYTLDNRQSAIKTDFDALEWRETIKPLLGDAQHFVAGKDQVPSQEIPAVFSQNVDAFRKYTKHSSFLSQIVVAIATASPR